MGAVGGGLYHTYKGLKNSPKGYKLKGTLETIRREAPKLGGSFANWGLMFSVFDCTCLYVRGQEDPFNAIIAGAATGGFLQLRSGLRPAMRSAMVGGVLLAIIEGLNITLQKMTSPPPPSMPFPQPGMAGMGPPPDGFPGGPPPPPGGGPTTPSSSGEGGGFWSSWFGGSSDTSSKPTDSTHTIHEEGFAPPPMPDFKSEELQFK